MARKRVNATFAYLARRRPELVGAHFGLSILMIEANAKPVARLTGVTASAVSTVSETAMTTAPASASATEKVPSPASGAGPRAASALAGVRPSAAPDGRLGFAVPKRQLARAVDRNALKRVAREAWRLAPWGDTPRPTAMLKLRRADPLWKTTTRGALKRAWRAELDELFARAVERVASAAAR